jgi:glycine cleavage system H protein
MLILGFEYPEDCFYMLEHDMWCKPQASGRVLVGVTAFGIHLSGDFYMCRPKPSGTPLLQGQTLALAELSKSVVSIKSPASGTVVEVNPLLEATPEIVHQDPYGRGWLALMAPDCWHENLALLAHGAALRDKALQRMQLENL